ncbi:RDD family protein [Geodermatophilus marinus]|nr:RDD family protein [Geodermatophilus sp. LHW52908]
MPRRPAVQGRRAGLVTRALANVLDVGVVLAVLAAGYAAVTVSAFLLAPRAFRFPAPPLSLLLTCGAVVTAAYFTVAWTGGRTWGARVLGVRPVSASGRPLGWALATLRAALCVAFPVGLLWVAVSPSRRSVQDVVLGTAVVYDWSPPGAR